MTACYCDGDGPLVYRAERPVARKRHTCDECGRPILPGERYERAVGLWDFFQTFDTFKTCCHCLAARDAVLSRVRCFCWSHGGLREEISEAIRFGWFLDEAPGLTFHLYWLEYERRQYRKHP